MSQPDRTFRTARSVIAELGIAEHDEDMEPRVTITYHDLPADSALKIVRAFPQLTWDAARSGSSEWMTGTKDDVEVTLFLRTENQPPPSLATDILKAVARGV